MDVHSTAVERGSQAPVTETQQPDTQNDGRNLYHAAMAEHYTIDWFQERFLNLIDHAEGLRTGIPRCADSLRNVAMNLLPSMGFGNTRHIFEEDGTYGGWRKKSATWPMTKREHMAATRGARVITFN